MTNSSARRARTALRRHVAATAVLVSATAVVVIAPTVAHASIDACTTRAGTTSNLALGPNGAHPTGGTIFTKQPPGCLDFNLIKVGAPNDHYQGWLFHSSTDQWKACNTGPVLGTNLPKVLCSNVATGTQMAVVQSSATQRSITMEF